MVSSPELGKTEHGVLWRSVIVVPCSNCRDVYCSSSTHLCCVPGRCRSLLDRCAGVGLVTFTSLLELWKSQHFTCWRSLSSNIAWYIELYEQWKCPPCAHLTDCWSPGLMASQDQMPNSWWDSGECTAHPAEAILISAVSDCSLSQYFSKVRQRHGASCWTSKEGSDLGGETNFLCVMRVRTWYWNPFKTSDPLSLVSFFWLLGGVQMVLSTRWGHL